MSKQLSLSATLAVLSMSIFALSTSFAGMGNSDAERSARVNHAAVFDISIAQ